MTDEKKDAPQLIYSGDYTKGAIGYCSSGRWAGWIFWKHPDGQWVSLAKIPDRPQPVADDAGGDELDVHDRLRHMTDDFKMSQHQCRHQSEQISALQVELAQAKAALRQPPAADMTASIPAADNRGVDVEATMSINAIQKAAGVLYDQLQPYMNAKSLGHAPIFMAYSTIMEQTMDLRDILRTTPEDHQEKLDAWFLYDGDDSGLAEFLAAVDYDWFTKAGRDKKQMFVVFLKSGERSTAAIRCQSQKNYQKLLAVLREESTQQPEHEVK